jgi:hypothetical protein
MLTAATDVSTAGTVRGSITSTAACSYSITAFVATATMLSTSTLLILAGGVLTTSDTGATTISTGVTVGAHILTGDGVYILDQCTVNGVATITASGTISKSPFYLCFV